MLSAKELLKRRAAVQTEDPTQSKKIQRTTQAHVAHHITRTNGTVSTTTTFLGTNSSPSTSAPAPLSYDSIIPVENLPLPEASPEKRSALSEKLQEFCDAKATLLDYLFEHEQHPLIGTPCSCGRAARLVCCDECLGHNATCSECFIDHHATMPTHWANVWLEDDGFFVRRDISTLRPDGYAIPLGHGGRLCPVQQQEDKGVYFHIIDHNGVHNTKIHFCSCKGLPDRVPQLMRFGLFPATMKQPTMAFTLNVLHQFHIHHLEAKESAYDFVGSLRRLTDNVFASDTSDPYPQFLSVMWFWRVLIAQKRLGQAHGIDECLPHRPKGNLIVFCPSCPEPGLNMEENWQDTPDELKHLHQTQLTADGNFHANRYAKNSGPDDYSLFDGLAYYPSEAEFQAYLKTIPKKDPNEKVECFTVKAATKKDKENGILSQTGVINIQCPHGCVKSCVDLQRGERFANTDYALATALRQTRQLHNSQDTKNLLKGRDFLFSYDISCAYLVNVVDRFKKNFPDLVPAVKQFRFLIPLVHVHNHKENCTYKYAASYIYNTGHFHGETAEHEWVELNQLAAQIRQMNNGHRQDAIIDHHSDWNFKKLANMPSALYNDIINARKLYAQKRDQFIGLTLLHADRVPLWNKEDRTKRSLNKNKQVECVYRHNQTKVPSRAKIYDTLINIEKSKDSNGAANSTGCRLVRCINEGLEIERLQRTLRAKVQISLKTPLDSLLKEIDLRRRKLRTRINKWKVFYQETSCISYDTLYEGLSQLTTSTTIPNIRDPTPTSTASRRSVKQAAEDRPECEALCLPSMFTEDQRIAHELQEFASCEMKLREGRAFDAIRTMQTIVKLIDGLRDDRVQNARGHTSVTRAIGKIDDAILRRNLQIEEYNACHHGMVLLGGPSYESLFPILTEKDTVRKSTHKRRGIGDSRQMEGRIWNTGVTGGAQVKQFTSLQFAPDVVRPMVAGVADVLTKGTKARARNDQKAVKDKKGTKRHVGITEVATTTLDARDCSNANENPLRDGWIWQFGSIGKLSTEDLQEWSEEADRVQFFRAEAEMQRWLEEHEIKQAQFMRCIRSFAGLSRTWEQLATRNTASPGRVAYAKKTAARFAQLEHRARQRFAQAGYHDRLNAMDKGIPLSSLVQRDREREFLEMGISHILSGRISQVGDNARSLAPSDNA